MPKNRFQKDNTINILINIKVLNIGMKFMDKKMFNQQNKCINNSSKKIFLFICYIQVQKNILNHLWELKKQVKGSKKCLKWLKKQVEI